ncbi:hypothetical protein BT93_E1308 [Corymbia citriodora subsp. variegata]|nr:hypothetical protein BT93_E1308 [Corymbia citriodora subsp. variegata]
MEPFLAAAERGNIDELKELIRSSELSLKDMAFKWTNYTPLHVACAAGHLNLVQALRELMPDFVERKDKYGLSPLHIAAAQGHVEIVRELLREREHLCSVKGQDNRIPLHYASENGKLEVMRELLSVLPKSVYKTTTEKETALHLAVKNDQFDAVVELVEHLKRHKMEEVINLGNDEGNTALHLAVSVKNIQVVDFVLGQHALRHVVVDVNGYNKSGRTPLDLSGREAGDRAITRSLKRAGAKHRRGRGSSLSLEAESKANIRDSLLVVAGLIVNATYQSVLQAPHFKTEVDKTYTKGFLAWYASWMTGIFGRDLAYIVFITGNTFGLLVSVQMIISLTKDLSVKLPMLLSMTIMVQTYYCHTYYLPFTTLEKQFGLKNVELLSVLPLTIPIFLLLIQRPLAEALESYLGELSLFVRLGDMYHI